MSPNALLGLAAAMLQPDGVQHVEQNALMEFSVSWPAAAEAIAPLRSALTRDMAWRRQAAASWARGQRAAARRGNYPYSLHYRSIEWTIEGSTPQLTSLSARVSATNGSGRSEEHFEAMLFDRLTNRVVAIAGLIDALAMVPRFCAAYPDALDAQLGSASLAEDDERRTCPTMGGRPIVPADRDGNGRFDTFKVLMAVNYFEAAEGYSVDVAVEPEDIERLPDGYRPAFEVPGAGSGS